MKFLKSSRTLLGEVASVRRWDKLFGAAPDLVEELANEAVEENRAGRTLELEPHNLNSGAPPTRRLQMKIVGRAKHPSLRVAARIRARPGGPDCE